MKNKIQKTLLGFFSLTFVFIAREVTAGAPTQAQFMKENLDQIHHAKNVNGYVDSAPLITKDLRKAIKAWARIKGASKIPAVTTQGSDFNFELNNKKAKFTLSDFEHHTISINDKPFQIDNTVPVSQNLDNILELMDPKHSVSISFFSAANAGQQVPPVDIGGAVVMGVLAYSFAHPETDPGTTSLPSMDPLPDASPAGH